MKLLAVSILQTLVTLLTRLKLKLVLLQLVLLLFRVVTVYFVAAAIVPVHTAPFFCCHFSPLVIATISFLCLMIIAVYC